MGFIESFVADVPTPPLYRVRQHFDSAHLENVPLGVEEQLASLPALQHVRGQSVGIALGSRGIASIAEVARTVVAWVKAQGGKPFIVPAMGSHGGATPAGQRAVLAHLGITEDSAGAPIHASMDVQVGGEVWGRPVYWSEEALKADRLILVNRVKPHTAFRGSIESGLTKMVAIGLGKRHGAETLHGLGPANFAETIPAFAAAILQRAPPVAGLALIENAHHQVCHVEALSADDFPRREPELLQLARRHMPRFYVDQFDVLVVDEIGKNISGDGMDPNITGRYPVEHVRGGASIRKVVVLGLTPGTGGNGNGIGLADFTTRRVIESIDWELTSINALSGMTTTTIKRPLATETEEEAIKLAIKTSTPYPEQVRLVRVRNTLELSDIFVSESLVDPLIGTGQVSVVGGPIGFSGAFF